MDGLALGVSGSPFVHQPSAAQKHRSAAPRQSTARRQSALIFAACPVSGIAQCVALVSLTSSPAPSAPPHAPLSPKCHCLWSTSSFLTTVQLHSQNHRCGGAGRCPAIQNPVVTQFHDPMLNNMTSTSYPQPHSSPLHPLCILLHPSKHLQQSAMYVRYTRYISFCDTSDLRCIGPRYIRYSLRRVGTKRNIDTTSGQLKIVNPRGGVKTITKTTN